MKITARSRVALKHAALGLAALAALDGGCSKSDAERTESGDVASRRATRATAVIATPAPGVHVTRSDVSSVVRAGTYRLSADNFRAFMRAADSVTALARRDSAVREYLGVNVSDAGPANGDAGLRWLKANEKVSGAIAASGITVEDYYAASIAVVNGEHELLHPKATPAENAEFLRMHTEDLARLHQMHRAR